MNTKLLGTAVGVALNNREALQSVSAPVMNVGQGAAQVIFRTLWKSTVVGVAMILVWIFMFGTIYILSGSPIMTHPGFLSFFGLVLFIVLPVVIFTKEARKVSKNVKEKNRISRENAANEKAVQAAQHQEAVAMWQAQQDFQAQQAQQQQQAFQAFQAQQFQN